MITTPPILLPDTCTTSIVVLEYAPRNTWQYSGASGKSPNRGGSNPISRDFMFVSFVFSPEHVGHLCRSCTSCAGTFVSPILDTHSPANKHLRHIASPQPPLWRLSPGEIELYSFKLASSKHTNMVVSQNGATDCATLGRSVVRQQAADHCSCILYGRYLPILPAPYNAPLD